IGGVHREDQIEPREIVAAELPSAVIELDSSTGSGRACARIGQLSDMPPTGSRAVDRDPFAQPGAGQREAHHTLGGRRAADVAKTDETDAHVVGGCTMGDGCVAVASW